MTKEQISKAIEECEEKLKKLRDELKRQEYSGKRWRPKKDEIFFFCGGSGDIFSFGWTGSNIDEELYTLGNAFPTQEAARFEIERRKVIAELSDYAEGDDAVWDTEKRHYFFYYDYRTNCIKYECGQCFRDAVLYFPYEEAARAAIEAVGKERVKKYYLRVKEQADERK